MKEQKKKSFGFEKMCICSAHGLKMIFAIKKQGKLKKSKSEEFSKNHP